MPRNFIALPKGTIDETGHTYGRLKVLEYACSANRNAYWLCLCDPALGGDGNRVEVRGDRLRNGRTVSCGCWRADPNIRQAARMKTPPRRRKQIAIMGGQARRNASR